MPFTYGAACMQSCPTGYSCNSMGVCAGGNQSGITLNVVQAPTVVVTGTVTHNGLQPTSGCGSASRATALRAVVALPRAFGLRVAERA